MLRIIANLFRNEPGAKPLDNVIVNRSAGSISFEDPDDLTRRCKQIFCDVLKDFPIFINLNIILKDEIDSKSPYTNIEHFKDNNEIDFLYCEKKLLDSIINDDLKSDYVINEDVGDATLFLEKQKGRLRDVIASYIENRIEKPFANNNSINKFASTYFYYSKNRDLIMSFFNAEILPKIPKDEIDKLLEQISLQWGDNKYAIDVFLNVNLKYQWIESYPVEGSSIKSLTLESVLRLVSYKESFINIEKIAFIIDEKKVLIDDILKYPKYLEPIDLENAIDNKMRFQMILLEEDKETMIRTTTTEM